MRLSVFFFAAILPIFFLRCRSVTGWLKKWMRTSIIQLIYPSSARVYRWRFAVEERRESLTARKKRNKTRQWCAQLSIQCLKIFQHRVGDCLCKFMRGGRRRSARWRQAMVVRWTLVRRAGRGDDARAAVKAVGFYYRLFWMPCCWWLCRYNHYQVFGVLKHSQNVQLC